MQKIIPHLWFNTQAKEATARYVSLFPDSKIENVTTITDTPSGDCDVVTFKLSGQDFEKIARVTQAFLKMKKFDIAVLRSAFEK
ncbi:MAG: VOC family protein [Minisyncoccota bacterium]